MEIIPIIASILIAGIGFSFFIKEKKISLYLKKGAKGALIFGIISGLIVSSAANFLDIEEISTFKNFFKSFSLLFLTIFIPASITFFIGFSIGYYVKNIFVKK